MRTYQTRIKVTAAQDAALKEYAILFSKVERKLFSEISAGKDPDSLKSGYLTKYRITARQYNAISRSLKGKVKSITSLSKNHLDLLKTKAKKTKKQIAKYKSTKHATHSKDRNALHQKKRKLLSLEHKITEAASRVKDNRIKLCFGSRKLFNAQYHLEESGYESHAEWHAAWQESRSNQFFVLGSKDETSGCQGCVATLLGKSLLGLKVRLPDALDGKYLNLEAPLNYGESEILNALDKQAISYRFKRDEKGWRVFIGTKELEVEEVSSRSNGAIGIDINVNHLAVAETDTAGNLIKYFSLPLVTYGKSSNQSKALIGDAVKELIARVSGSKKPIVLEKLSFKKKKSELDKSAAKYSRMLSSFAYELILSTIKSRSYDAGLEVKNVNPAYTSLIGKYKYAARYGISVHLSAALVIARRGLRFSERPNRRGHNAFIVPVRNLSKHVWSYWARVARKRVVHVAHSESNRSLLSHPVFHEKNWVRRCETHLAITGGIPVHESSSVLFG